ncbi:MAG: signal peptide peptidase SppA [Muribaculaceae bacterium]|nr:signal peptide peptidase SppA [Muribaculaceae bacterium]
MLKRFFISMLGTMAGLWISIFLLFFGGVMVAVMALGKNAGDSNVKVSRHSVLVLDLSGNVEERFQPGSFMSFIQKGENNAPTLEELLTAVRGAASDDKIEGMYIKCGGAAMGMAAREELLEAINDYKESGKWIFAYSDTYAQGDYMIATTADSIMLNPVGAVDIHGIGGMTPFFTGLLDKLGVKMQIIKVGTYKSAVEPYVLKEMSEPARRQMQQYIDSVWSFVSGTIAENRDIPVGEIDHMAANFVGQSPAETFVEKNLVTSLAYERTVDDAIRRQLGLDEDEDINYISTSQYVESADIKNILGGSGKKHIALLYAVGDIVDSGNDGIVGPDMVSQICELADDDHVKGMVLRVNSPGGSAFASEQIWEALQYFKSKDKPLYVSMGDYAASGGYYISCGADSIFADLTTLTGSIGVFGMIPDLSGLVTDKLGVTFTTVESNPNAAGISLTTPMTPEQHAAMQKGVDRIYELFTGRVAAGRHMDIDSVKAIAEGRVWVGADAIRLGLVDRIGSLHTAVEAMADALDMDGSDVVAYPKTEDKIWMTILRNSGEFSDMKLGEMPYDAETARMLDIVKNLRTMNPMQARMEAIEIK